jgi:uncharacterized protein YcaQ
VTEPRTLTARELNRALLARQMLLRRAKLSLPKALERMGGLQAQYAPSMYVGLWSRLEGFERDVLTRALVRRSVVQGTLMRMTIHLVSRRDYWLCAVATRPARRERWLRATGRKATEQDMVEAARIVRSRMSARPATRAELEELIGRERLQGVGLWIDLVRVPPSGTWERRRADLYRLAEDWVGKAPGIARDDAVAHLVRRYLAAFGPATPRDVVDWSGVSPQDVDAALATIRLREFRDETGARLVDLPRAPLPDPETPAPVRLLPTWDATLLAHARRTGILPEEHRPKIFSSKTPQSFPTFLVDGVVAGTWRHERDRIEIAPFGRLDGAARRAVREETDRILAELFA